MPGPMNRATDPGRRGPVRWRGRFFRPWMVLVIFPVFMAVSIIQSQRIMKRELGGETDRLRGSASSACRNLEVRFDDIRDDFRLLVSVDAFRPYLEDLPPESPGVSMPLVKRFFARHQEAVDRIELSLKDGQVLVLRILPGNYLGVDVGSVDGETITNVGSSVRQRGSELVISESVPPGEDSGVIEARLVVDQASFFSSQLASYLMGQARQWIWFFGEDGRPVLVWNPSPLSSRTFSLPVDEAQELVELRKEGVELVHEHLLVTDTKMPVISAISPLSLGEHPMTLVFSIEKGDYLGNLNKLSILLFGTFLGTLAVVILWFSLTYARIIGSERAEIAAREAAEHAAKVKSEFVAAMSHEIRTPLNAVLGYTELLKDSGLTGDQMNHADVITASGRHLLSVLNDILDFSRLEAGAMDLACKPFSPVGIAKEVISTFHATAEGKDLRLRLDVRRSTPDVIDGDPRRVRQILFNLIGNGVKFTRRGSVSVVVEGIGEGPEALRFSVIDTGVGIPEAMADEVFEPFRQAEGSSSRSYGGSGLGLAICKRLADQMRGSIALEQNQPVGSVFRFTIPVACDGKVRRSDHPLDGIGIWLVGPELRELKHRLIRLGASIRSMDELPCNPGDVTQLPDPSIIFFSPAHGDSSAFIEACKSRKSSIPRMSKVLVVDPHGRAGDVSPWARVSIPPDDPELVSLIQESLRAEVIGIIPPVPPKVLVVDDNLVNRQLVLKLLHSRGLRVDTAESGRAALDRLAAGDYGLVLMDVDMPDMDGLETTRQIRRNEAQRGLDRMLIIGLSAHAFAQDRERALEAGMDDYLIKPVDVGRLFELALVGTGASVDQG